MHRAASMQQGFPGGFLVLLAKYPTRLIHFLLAVISNALPCTYMLDYV